MMLRKPRIWGGPTSDFIFVKQYMIVVCLRFDWHVLCKQTKEFDAYLRLFVLCCLG